MMSNSEQKINEFILKITGGAYLGEEVDRTKQLIIKHAELSIYDVNMPDNEDGTYDKVYKAKIVSPILFEQGEKSIKGRDKTRQSVKVRYAIQSMPEALNDREEFYKMFTDKIISNPDEVWNRIKDL